MTCALLGCTGSCPDLSLPHELEREKLKIAMSLYSAFPYRWRIRFSPFSTAQTGQGIKQHFIMWELITRERLSRGFGWGRELEKGRQTQ